jgi:hypothetical protein
LLGGDRRRRHQQDTMRAIRPAPAVGDRDDATPRDLLGVLRGAPLVPPTPLRENMRPVFRGWFAGASALKVAGCESTTDL